MSQQSARGKNLTEASESILSQHLWIKILVGMFAGLFCGLILSPHAFGLLEQDLAYSSGEWFALPGVIFLGLIKMVIIPLIFCSIVLGIIDSGEMETVKKIGIRLVPYFIATTAISISIGLLYVNFIKPGQVVDLSHAKEVIAAGAAADRLPQKTFENLTIPQRIANIIPTNVAKAQVERDMLQIVIASIIIGLALMSIDSKTRKPLKDLCVTGQVLSMKIIGWAMPIAPYAVFGLLTNITIRVGLDAILSVGLYMFTVIAGLITMMLIYLLFVKFIGKLNITAFLKGIREAQLLAFSTSSSAATMPFSIQAAEENLGIKPEISRFVIPLGATINMDGTAMYQAIAAIFLCQVFGVDLTMSETILLLVTTVGASIGTPATPGVGIIVLATILVGIGVPAEGIGLIIGVDRILDMCRTTINVTGDLTATIVMQKLLGHKVTVPQNA